MKMASVFKSAFDDIAKVESQWQPFTMGSEPDLVKTLGDGRLTLTTAGKDNNGHSIFTRDFPQDERTGQVDHLKFSLLANGPHGGRFVVPEEGSISVEAQMGATVTGLEKQPFGAVVQDAQSDFRLGTGVLMLMDPEHMNVFDFFVTNTEIYAVYERGKSKGWPETSAAYSYEIPLLARTENQTNRLKITYTKSTNTVTWSVDDVEMFRVDNVGRLIPRKFMAVDNGGQDGSTPVNEFQTGLAGFSLMDGSLDGHGLINLTGGEYFDPQIGSPKKVRFVDDQSLKQNRLFGQGVKVWADAFEVRTVI